MKPIPIKQVARALAAAGFALAALTAQAQTYPEKPVKLVIPYPPGGMADTYARTLGQGLSDRLNQPVIAENKPGGSLIIGTDAVAKSPGDGYTLLLASASGLALNVGAFKKLPYDPQKDFEPVALTFYTPLYLMVTPGLPVHSVKELVAYAKNKPGALSFASLGHGSSLHLAGEMFKSMAGIDILHVPYKGTTTALPDLMNGRVSMIFDGGAFLPHAKSGKVRLLAVTSKKRLPLFPDVPTMEEAGVPGYEVDFWFGIVAPAGTPKPVIERLGREIASVQQDGAFQKRLAGFANIQLATTPAQEFARIIERDIQRWKQILKDAGVEPQ